jgi:NAD(P)-dependent dehydrogenase (short-subunit alcohol dehydrogenase family)
MALTGGKSTVTATIDGSTVRDVIVIEILDHFLGRRLPKQALAWYASTVTHADGGPPFSFGLSGRVVLVTGGVRGVGAGISSVFAQQGATVVTCARREVEGLPYEFHPCDIRDDDAVKAMVDTIVDRHGRLDVVVNNAGGSPFVLTAESSAKFNRKIIELNLIGALSVSQHANETMQNQTDGGSIVNICSLSGRRPSPGTGAYGAAKAGLESLTQTLAVEWGPKVRVNACVVGMVETEQSELFYGDAESIAAISKNVPLGRLATPADVGWAAAFLASDAAAYISGASLEVHGGGEPPHYLATTNASAIT